MELGELFDAYSLRARLQPALLTVFPAFVTVAAWLPALYQTAVGLIGLATACGVTVFLAHVARERGRVTEKRLFAAWGGKPTTIWLRHRDSNLDPHTKDRYHEFLSSGLRDWRAPTHDEERLDPIAADSRYDTAVRWLLEYTRDKSRFPLVFKENVSYGFRRNLRGLRSIGWTFAVTCIIANALPLWCEYILGKPSNLGGAASLTVSVIVTLAWMFFVNDRAVKDAADAYARAFLSSCDSLHSP